ncbi:MAG: LytTR family transcriptional regulator DNA-binding domain-containing protein [Paeniclostridium sordellii]|uniref:LytTR family DNA-binding domain-containing protein n=1 Tax=Paraclostridium sordellii TaxID=1505 RepID=UPI000E54CF8E|nr:LytTR family DNA-binding domain-containing protein [Paeniclostridium sordellii]MBS6023052.1 LytTR family transcriptional regulator DNA-binding domain-containing protein [Paeniclostridium sordellii]RGX11494.1 LytTR family transcriptional regulator [Paeniclostridium sordellii]
MNVIVEKQEDLIEDKVVIYCREESQEIKRIKGFIKNINMKLCVSLDCKKIMITPEEIYYIESVDKRTFVYIKDKVLECSLRLYEIEERFKEFSFFRASKSTIVNVMYIKDINILLNRNLLVTLENKEKLIISRRNVKDFRKLIGWE